MIIFRSPHRDAQGGQTIVPLTIEAPHRNDVPPTRTAAAPVAAMRTAEEAVHQRKAAR